MRSDNNSVWLRVDDLLMVHMVQRLALVGAAHGVVSLVFLLGQCDTLLVPIVKDAHKEGLQANGNDRINAVESPESPMKRIIAS